MFGSIKPHASALPLAAWGLAAPLLALLLWVLPLSSRAYDVVIPVLCVLGLGGAVSAYVLGGDLYTRRLAVVAMGCNAIVLSLLGLVYF